MGMKNIGHEGPLAMSFDSAVVGTLRVDGGASSRITRIPADFVYAFLTGTGGATSLVTNAAGSVSSYSYVVPAGRTFDLERINFSLIDAGSEPGQFGGVASLTTGCGFAIVGSNGTTVKQNFANHKIQHNQDWVYFAGVDMLIQSGTPNDAVSVRWTLAKAGAAVRMVAGESIVFTVADDLTGLIEGGIMVQGVLNRSD